MRVDTAMRNVRVALRANTIIAGIHGRRLATRSALGGFAGLVAAFGLLMLGIAIFFALETVWGRVWAAVAVGLGNLALAAIVVLIAARMKPGRDLGIATEVRDAAVEAVVGDLRAVEEDIAALAKIVRHPLDQAVIAGLATPLVAMILKSVKKDDGAK